MAGFGDHNRVEIARAFALPSRLIMEGGVPGGEGFGIIYAEAAVFGRPVVGSVAAGAAEAVVDRVTGRTVDPADDRTIGDAVLEYLEHADRADRCGSSGRARALERFTRASFARDLASGFPGASFRRREGPRRWGRMLWGDMAPSKGTLPA